MAKGTYTLWGTSDYSEKISTGIMWYSTPSHGGYHLSSKKNALVPEYMRNLGGWYEEDCDWSIVVVVFPGFFDKNTYDNAKKTLKQWHPESYEKFFEKKEKND